MKAQVTFVRTLVYSAEVELTEDQYEELMDLQGEEISVTTEIGHIVQSYGRDENVLDAEDEIEIQAVEGLIIS